VFASVCFEQQRGLHVERVAIGNAHLLIQGQQQAELCFANQAPPLIGQHFPFATSRPLRRCRTHTRTQKDFQGDRPVRRYRWELKRHGKKERVCYFIGCSIVRRKMQNKERQRAGEQERRKAPLQVYLRGARFGADEACLLLLEPSPVNMRKFRLISK
jgi:hypothetical protein